MGTRRSYYWTGEAIVRLPEPGRDAGVEGLAAAILELAIHDASQGPVLKKARHAHRWAVLPRQGADSVYCWLLGSTWALYWASVAGLEPDFFREQTYKTVEANRRALAMERIGKIGRITEVLAGVR